MDRTDEDRAALHDRLPNEHYVETLHTYRAHCSCGWGSGYWKTTEAADYEYGEHERRVHA